MKRDLMRHLVCPECRGELTLRVDEEVGGEVKTGSLRCVNDHPYPVTGFIPRFVDADAYAGSFSRQRLYVRKHFKHYVNDKSGDRLFEPTTSISDEDLRNGLTLEVGCGYGRFVDVVQRRGGEVIGIDLSTHSIELAQDFIGHRPKVHLVQCDLFKLPFPEGYFSQIYSVGVLHHTPDTRRAFAALVPYVAPEGRISIWVYHPADKTGSNRWRRFTTRMNHQVLYGWCIANQILFSWIRALPGGWRFSLIVPGGGPKGRPFWTRVLGDFDDLSPQFAHVHSESEVAAWFEAEGLQRVQNLKRRTAVTGTQPGKQLPVGTAQRASTKS